MRNQEHRPPGVLTEPGPADKLRDIQSITDAALSALDPQRLLGSLCERIREALQADTAAVLLLDRKSSQLIATAASGLEEEVQQGVRIPLGIGFAGQIAAQGRPVILPDIRQGDVINPILTGKGVRSLMGAPLLADGIVVGVLHVGTLSPRAFTSEDADLLQLAADRAALAVQTLTARLDSAAAAALQRSLLPTALPAIDGLDMAARFVPGSGTVGGDWYDVFRLPSGSVCAVIGDVTGTGLNAAVIMGRMRSSLRSYALETDDPADVLHRLNRKMHYFEPEAMATVLCAMVSPVLDQVRMSCAGHLPPLLAQPGRPAQPVVVAADVPIGLSSPVPRRVTTAALPPGSALCLYTDGLVERRDRYIDEGIGLLCAAVTAADPEDVCVSAMSAMFGYIPHTDDVALLILRRRPGHTASSGSGTGPEPAADVR